MHKCRAGLALFSRLVLLAVLAGLLGQAALAQVPAEGSPAVMGARVSEAPHRARLVLDLSTVTEFAVVTLTGPDRIAVDVRATGLTFGSLPPPAGEGMVSSFAVQMAGPDRARATLVLEEPAQVQQAYLLEPFADQPARLVVDLIPDTPEAFAARAAEHTQESASIAPEPPLADTSTPPGASEVPSGSRPLVVIDPGHGGVDSGAETPNGVKEKDIVLAFALKLQKLLVDSGRFDVALTREDDSFLTLEDRVTLARQNKADLLISLHADSFQQHQIRGASIYTRDEKATDVLDKVLADQENRVDIIAGFAMPEMTPAVVDILVDLMRRQMRKQSYLAAEAIIGQLAQSTQLRKFPVRQADFFVLQAPDVPSLLVELGFLSNEEDIANLTKQEWQDRVAEALARGIASYFDTQVPA